MNRTYNNVAIFYDQLADLFYGKAISLAEQQLVQFVPANARVLIIGGGTGRILEKLAQHHTTLYITYLDSSSAMIAKAAQRKAGENKVQFLMQNGLVATFAETFDVVITSFFLDNFCTSNVEGFIGRLAPHLATAGIWLIADFQKNKNFRQTLLLKIMYGFFKLTCNIEATQLPDIHGAMLQNRLALTEKKCFSNNFIYVAAYRWLG